MRYPNTGTLQKTRFDTLNNMKSNKQGNIGTSLCVWVSHDKSKQTANYYNMT